MGWAWCVRGLGHPCLLIDTDLEEKPASEVFTTEDSGAHWSWVLDSPTGSGARAGSLNACVSKRYFQVIRI